MAGGSDGKANYGTVELDNQTVSVREDDLHPVAKWFLPRLGFGNNVGPRNESSSEVAAWAMDAAAKGPLNMSGAFLGTALLVLAKEDATAGDDSDQPKIYGLRPSSLLTVSSVIVTLAAAAVMPLFGAIVDYTPHRKSIGLATAVAVALLNGAQSFVSGSTWPLMLLLLIFSNFLYIVHSTIVLAYLPGLTSDENVLAGYTAWFSIVHFITVSGYVLVIIAITAWAGGDTLYTAQISHVVSFLITTPLLCYAWAHLFRSRPALHELPPGKRLLTAGFSELAATSTRILRADTPLPYLRVFMFALLFCPDAGSGNYISVFVTFMTEQMKMSGSQIGLVTLFIMLSTIPGSLLSTFMCRRFNALLSFKLCIGWWILTNTLASWILSGPERTYLAYFPFSFMWGVQFGWLFPSQRVLFCTLIPPGRETELMGMFAFFGQIMGWAPPLLFSWINELGFSMRLGLLSSDVFLVLAFAVLLFIDDYDLAVRQAKKEICAIATRYHRCPGITPLRGPPNLMRRMSHSRFFTTTKGPSAGLCRRSVRRRDGIDTSVAVPGVGWLRYRYLSGRPAQRGQDPARR